MEYIVVWTAQSRKTVKLSIISFSPRLLGLYCVAVRGRSIRISLLAWCIVRNPAWPLCREFLYKILILKVSSKVKNTLHSQLRTAVAQWLRCLATNRKDAGSISAGVTGFFIDIKSFRSHYGPGVDSASNRNEYQEYFLGVKAAGA